MNPGYTEWPKLLPPVSRSILRAAENAVAKLVYADGLYAYGPVRRPLREDLPALATGRKGRIRGAVAAELLAAHSEGRVRVVIGRASDYYGPHGTNSNAGDPVFGRAVKGKRPLWNGRLDQTHTFHFLPDIARGLITLAEREEADGEVWHLPAAPPLTAQQFFDLVFEAAGRSTPAKACTIWPIMLAIAGLFSPLLRELPGSSHRSSASCARPPTSTERPSSPISRSSSAPSVSSTQRPTAKRLSGRCSGSALAPRDPRHGATSGSKHLFGFGLHHIGW